MPTKPTATVIATTVYQMKERFSSTSKTILSAVTIALATPHGAVQGKAQGNEEPNAHS